MEVFNCLFEVPTVCFRPPNTADTDFAKFSGRCTASNSDTQLPEDKTIR